MWRSVLLAFALSACMSELAGSARAREVHVPIRVDYPFLRALLIQRAFSDPEQTARVYSDGVDCKHVVLLHPELRGSDGAISVVSDVETKLGTLVLGICLFPVEWRGRIESRLEPRLDPTLPLVHFRVLESKLLESDGSERAATSALWDWLERYVHPRLERLAIDLSEPMQDLRAVLPLFLSGSDGARAQALVDSLALESVAVTEREVVIGVRLDAPPAGAPPPPRSAEPALGPEEIARFEAALSHWDGFITTVVKHAGTQTSDSSVRAELLEVLLDARAELVAALRAPASAEGDPVRPLFLSTWRRLAGVLRDVGEQAGDRGALRILGFIAAADALAALDELGPEFGLEMSSDGLRRLARVLTPTDPADPLEAPEGVDPELRRALDFGDPLPPPDLEMDDAPAPAPPPAREPAPSRSQLDSALHALAAFLAPSASAAAVRRESLERLTRDEQRRLRGWVPSLGELDAYLPLMQRLLRSAAEDALQARSTAIEVRRTYIDTQLATAWQETCWRHYARVRGQVRAIRSSAGAVGVMQVNSRVWRGFYDPRFLIGDVSYNARAGSEILLRYFLDLAFAKGEHLRAGGLDNLARAAYAAYNGGPSDLLRYRSAKAPRRARAIDAHFYEKYRAVRAGRELDVAGCFG
jgi:hypothetical protein